MIAVNKLPGARKTGLPNFIEPQLATLVREPPPGDQWLHELKFDGYRMLCRIDRGKVRFWSRNGKDWTAKFLNVVEALKSLPVKSAILDGEIVVVDAQGQSSFQKLHSKWALHSAKGCQNRQFQSRMARPFSAHTATH